MCVVYLIYVAKQSNSCMIFPHLRFCFFLLFYFIDVVAVVVVVVVLFYLPLLVSGISLYFQLGLASVSSCFNMN